MLIVDPIYGMLSKVTACPRYLWFVAVFGMLSIVTVCRPYLWYVALLYFNFMYQIVQMSNVMKCQMS